MIKNRKIPLKSTVKKTESSLGINLEKIGIVSRDYRDTFPNGYRDFSYALSSILEVLDKNECDSVLFSLFSIISREDYCPKTSFDNLENIKVIFLEKFIDGTNREAGQYVVYYKTSSGWEEYSFSQVFGTITGMPKKEIVDFVKYEVSKRILGDCCVLLCGETNGVKYSKSDKKIHDVHGLREAIPEDVDIILNPIHDRMTRFEMKLKRAFLSENNRWVISVWNRGKQDINGTVRDGKKTPWTIYYDGKEVEIKKIPNEIGVDIGIFDRGMA